MKQYFFVFVCALALIACTPTQHNAPTLPILFENGQWAAELGTVITHTPSAGKAGAEETWSIEDGMLRITNTIPGTRNIPFRWVFQHNIDIRGYDAVVMELESPPNGFFRPVLRFRIDQDAAFDSDSHTNIIRMSPETYNVIPPNTGFSPANIDLQRLRGVGALPDYGQTVRIKRIFLEGDGVIAPAAISQRNIMDIIPPRTGNTPVTEITTSPQYTGTIEWYPRHTTFQPSVEYTATITLTPKHGWTFEGVPANWFRVFDRMGNDEDNTLVHEAGANVLTRTFAATLPITPYPPQTKFVALTFDDTPSVNTLDLLDVLKENGLTVSFFVSGVNLERAREGHPHFRPDFKEAVERIIAEGHELVNHAWQHDRWDDNANVDVMRADFMRTQELIEYFQGNTNRWIRFPYGAGTHSGSNALQVAGELGMSNLRGPGLPDWDANNSSGLLLHRMLTMTGNNAILDGQIYVLHDQPGQTNIRQALPEIAHELNSRGFGTMTLSQMRDHKNFTAMPGGNYHNFSGN